MKIEFENLIDLEEKEIGIVFIPTIILDKYYKRTNIIISWLCFSIVIDFD